VLNQKCSAAADASVRVPDWPYASGLDVSDCSDNETARTEKKDRKIKPPFP